MKNLLTKNESWVLSLDEEILKKTIDKEGEINILH